MPERGPNQRRVVILNALRVELEAVCAHLEEVTEEIHRGTIYRRGTFAKGSYSWDVVVVQTGRGGYGAAAETERAISFYHPELMLFVGVAGGRKDVRHGDVVIATKVYAYESGKAGDTFQTRPEVGRPSYRLEQRAEVEAAKKDWHKRLADKLPNPEPRVHLGPIAAGGSVITSFDSNTEKLLQANYDDTLAVEMESYGFLEAVHRTDQKVEALIIRGISDLINDKAEAEAQHWQEVAALHASAFAFEILAKLMPVDSQRDEASEHHSVPSQQTVKPHSDEQSANLQSGHALSSPSDSHQAPNVTPSLQNYYVRLEKESELFKKDRVNYPDQCSRIIDLMTSLDEFLKPNQRNTHELGKRKQLSDIRGHLSTLKAHLQDFREICEFPRNQQQSHQLRQTIRDKFDLLLTDLERILENK